MVACGVVKTIPNNHPCHVAYDTSAQLHDTSAVDLEKTYWKSTGGKYCRSLVLILLMGLYICVVTAFVISGTISQSDNMHKDGRPKSLRRSRDIPKTSPDQGLIGFYRAPNNLEIPHQFIPNIYKQKGQNKQFTLIMSLLHADNFLERLHWRTVMVANLIFIRYSTWGGIIASQGWQECQPVIITQILPGCVIFGFGQNWHGPTNDKVTINSFKQLQPQLHKQIYEWARQLIV